MEVAPYNLRFPDADSRQWTKFVERLSMQEIDDISDSGKLGLFGIGARRLQTLNLMKNVKKVDFEDKTIYMGSFTPPLSMERFLSSPKIQYNIFKTSMTEYRDAIVKGKLTNLLGKSIGGESLTMSGLIGLASQAGIKGAKSWIAKPEERERFPHTTQIFIETNGIF